MLYYFPNLFVISRNGFSFIPTANHVNAPGTLATEIPLCITFKQILGSGSWFVILKQYIRDLTVSKVKRFS